jgi:predicted permease
MRVESLLSFSISPERNGYTPADSAALFARIEEELAALPGVTQVASSLLSLLANNSTTWDVRVPGYEPLPSTRPTADFNGVSPRFFDTLDIPLLAGRDFGRADAGPDRPRVAIVNQTFAQHFALGANAVGTQIGAGQGDAFDIEIVGVIRDAKYDNVKDPIGPQLFLPRGQLERTGTLTFYVRNAGDSESAAASIRNFVARLDSNLPIMNMQTVDRQVRENLFLDRFMGTLAVALAVLATLLAAVGLYGVLSYMVAQRTREIGLRMALGAAPVQLRGMVLRQVGGMAAIGGAIGLGAAITLGQAASALLFGVQVADPLVLSTAIGGLATIVFGATYLPARRASRVDPMTALRSE